MELENVDVILGMTIASIILGIGLSMFFIQPYTGYGAVVLAIGMMTLSLMITARPRVVERVKREIVFQPTKQTEPTQTPTNSSNVIAPQPEPTPPTQVENQSEQASASTPSTEPLQKEEKPTAEPMPSQPPESHPAQIEEPVAATPS